MEERGRSTRAREGERREMGQFRGRAAHGASQTRVLAPESNETDRIAQMMRHAYRGGVEGIVAKTQLAEKRAEHKSPILLRNKILSRDFRAMFDSLG